MWKQRVSSFEGRRAEIPQGMRVYAIGDVHGRVDLLDDVLYRIDEDLVNYPSHRPIHVFLGDYIDRGPSSRAVLDRLILRQRTHETYCLKGNHELLLLEFLRRPGVLDLWRGLGGLDTLKSYGLSSELVSSPAVQIQLAGQLERALPESHRRFLAELQPSLTCGDYFFVHAGVRPGIPLDLQAERDLLWIRDEFLSHSGDFGKFVVHGHTPVPEPDIRSNRINIDTGAYATGLLTCLLLEGDQKHFI